MASVAFALLCVCAALGAGEAAFAPILNTHNLGQLVGVQEYSEDGTPYYSFKGLPYAAPPVGPLRFKEPRESWPVPKNTLVNATTFGPACLQVPRHSSTVRGSEDCLLLNVYTPSASQAQGELYPVLVYVHDGTFTEGNASASPDRVVSRGIVVVTIQYRVGVLGFLSSGDRDLPGNFGLLDQQLALRWIQENIYEFCGDRDRVTLSGLSAGGASVTLQMVSPGSRGLFQRAIVSSSVFLNPWVLHNGAPDKVRAIARSVGCPCADNTPIAVLMPCLRSADPNKLAESRLLFAGWNDNPISAFGPVIDRNFVSEDPYKFLSEGNVARVPLLLSFSTVESRALVAEISDNSTALAELDRNWMQLAPLVLDYEESAWTESDRDFISSTIRSQYFGRAPINNRTVPQLVQLEADRRFLSGIDNFAKTLASANGSQPVYMYLYSYEGESDSTQFSDAAQVLPPSNPSPRDRSQADRGMAYSLVDIWEAFIKTGVPTTPNFPVWNPVPTSGDRLTLWNITSYNTGALVTRPELGARSFWRVLPLLESGLVD